jgi:hypothetical protein
MTPFWIGGAIFVLLIVLAPSAKVPVRRLKPPKDIFDLLFPKYEDPPRRGKKR